MLARRNAKTYRLALILSMQRWRLQWLGATSQAVGRTHRRATLPETVDLATTSTGTPARAKTRKSGRQVRSATGTNPGAYHHGDLRRTLLDAATESIAEHGPANVSLRALAAKAGVSHAAPVHHFGDKAGLFSAVAAAGFVMLGDELTEVWDETGDFLEVGVAYVRFAVRHKGNFEVMFQPELLNSDDPTLKAAKHYAERARDEPLASVAPQRDARGAHLAGLASWSIAHGLATLAVSGNLDHGDGEDFDDLARNVLMHLGVL